jgi:hypothetical protein
MKIKQIINEIKNNPYVEWVDDSYLSIVKNNSEFLTYITNSNIPRQGHVHGYIPLFGKLIKELEDNAIVVELGNREGLSTLSAINYLKEKQQFFSVDIINDLRFVPNELKNKDNVNFIFGDCLSTETINKIPNEISLIFLDTIHTYDQVKKEFESYKDKLKDGAIILIDDININDKGIFFNEWVGEKYDLTDWCHVSGFGLLIYNK